LKGKHCNMHSIQCRKMSKNNKSYHRMWWNTFYPWFVTGNNTNIEEAFSCLENNEWRL